MHKHEKIGELGIVCYIQKEIIENISYEKLAERFSPHSEE